MNGLHLHISKTHSWKPEQYYHTFYPRTDLYTGELIKYKTLEQYNSDSFNSRENFANWVREEPNQAKVREFCLRSLKDRLSKKGSDSLPAQVELKSLMLPSVFGWEKLFGSTENFVKALDDNDIQPKYNYTEIPTVKSGKDFVIYEDSREQMPLLLDCKVEKLKLPVGDYTISKEYFSDVYVERKSLNDLVGTLTGGLERFENEIKKAKDLSSYIVVLVEDLFQEVYHYVSTNRYTKKVNGAHIFHVIRRLMSEYDNIQFLFAGNRRTASEICVKILKMGSQVRNVDLEYLKDKGFFKQ